MSSDDTGVVVIGRNEGKRLIRCLASVKSQTNNIVYVDSGSTDDSTAAAKEFGATVVVLDLSQPFTAGRARNAGFAAIKTLRSEMQFVQFIDGDCILARDWLRDASAFLKQRSDVAVVCGRRRELHPTETVYNRLADIEWDTPIGEATTCGGDTLIRVEAFEAVRGFRPQLIAGEEPELCVRLRALGWKIWRLDAEMTQHDAAMTRFGQWWTRTVRCGYAYAEVSQLHRGSPTGIWRRETTRAVFWGGVLPAALCLCGLIHPIILGCGLAYFLQIFRIAFARGLSSSESWTYAAFVTLGKFAEFRGFLKFYWSQWCRRSTRLIEYK